MKALDIAAVNLRRFLRYRSNVFWVFLFPMLLILVLGSAFGGNNDPRLGVFGGGDGGLADDLIALLDEGPELEVVEVGSTDDLVVAVERGELEAGLAIPADYDAALRSGSSVTCAEARVMPSAFPPWQSVQVREYQGCGSSIP